MKLTEITPGKSGRLLKVTVSRLIEIGLVPGTKVTVVSRGLFGNPLEIAFSGNNLLIDIRTASNTEVVSCD